MEKLLNKKNLILAVILIAILVTGFMPVQFASAEEIANKNKVPRMVTVTFWGQDGTQMSFNWNTTDYIDSDVWVVEADDASGFNSAKVIKTQGEYHISRASASDGFIHTCVVSGLKLGTKYLYKVGDAELNIFSEVGSFTTESGDAKPFTFIHVSDPQSDAENYYKIYKEVLRSAVDNCKPSFIVNTGDIVNNNWLGYVPNLDQWEWALTDTFDVMKDYPIVATAGNHEAADYDFASRFNFDTPSGASTKSGVYYSFNYNNAHFIALNTNDTTDPHSSSATGLSDEQINWLKSDLEANKEAKWKIVMMHKAFYDCGDGGNNTLGTDYDVMVMRKQLAPLFTQYGVDLVLQGHDHLYSKSYPLSSRLDGEGEVISNATTTEIIKKEYNGGMYDFYNNPNGTIYINSGSASGWKVFNPVQNYPTDLIEKADKGTVMYTAVTVDGENLFVHTYTLDGKFESVPYYSFGVAKTALNNSNDTTAMLPVWALTLIIVASVLIVICAVILATVFILKSKRKNVIPNEISTEEKSENTENKL